MRGLDGGGVGFGGGLGGGLGVHCCSLVKDIGKCKRKNNGKSKSEMRGFFLPQPASWPGTPFAALRMTNKQKQAKAKTTAKTKYRDSGYARMTTFMWLRQNDDLCWFRQNDDLWRVVRGAKQSRDHLWGSRLSGFGGCSVRRSCFIGTELHASPADPLPATKGRDR
jgi:hypothetical protein